jgi:HPt (histidine-containing phosphotransfer) domain-containing protein
MAIALDKTNRIISALRQRMDVLAEDAADALDQLVAEMRALQAELERQRQANQNLLTENSRLIVDRQDKLRVAVEALNAALESSDRPKES